MAKQLQYPFSQTLEVKTVSQTRANVDFWGLAFLNESDSMWKMRLFLFLHPGSRNKQKCLFSRTVQPVNSTWTSVYKVI